MRGISILILTLLLCSWGCREAPDVPASRNKLYAEFFVRYLSAEQQIKGQVSFRQGVDRVSAQPWQPTGEVLFELQAMERDELPDKAVRFTQVRYGSYRQPFVFHFPGLQGKYLQYEIKSTPLQNFFVQGPISKSRGATFVVHGGILHDQEKMVFAFVNADKEVRTITVEGPTKDIGFDLRSEQMADLSTGPGRLYLIKHSQKQEVHPTIEITSTVECYTNDQAIIIEE